MLRRLMMASNPSVSGFAATVMSLSPWGYWRLNDASGPTAIDSSGNGRSGTADSGVVFGTAGLFAGTGGAATLGGASTNSRIALPSLPATADGLQKLTIMCTFRAATAKLQHLISADDTTRAWQFRLSASGTIEVITFSPAFAVTLTAPGNYSDGNPHIAVVVFDDSLPSADGTIKVYVDGSLVVASTGSQRYSPPAGAPAPAIGVRAVTSMSEPFGGTMDDCAIFQKALTASEVAAIWAARNTP